MIDFENVPPPSREQIEALQRQANYYKSIPPTSQFELFFSVVNMAIAVALSLVLSTPEKPDDAQ